MLPVPFFVVSSTPPLDQAGPDWNPRITVALQVAEYRKADGEILLWLQPTEQREASGTVTVREADEVRLVYGRGSEMMCRRC